MLLQESAVLCVGLGGLGHPVASYLVGAGIGRIGLVDFDTVDITNLHRQVLFGEQDQGKSKVHVVHNALTSLNSDVQIDVWNTKIDHQNIEKIFTPYDIIVDCTDNMHTKFLLNDACVKFGKILVFGSIAGFDAQVSVFGAQDGPCFRCLYPNVQSNYVPNCLESGLIGALAGIVGSIQALEAIKNILIKKAEPHHHTETLRGKLWVLDAQTMESHMLTIQKNKNCPTCAATPEDIVLPKESSPAVCPLHKDAVLIDIREDAEVQSGMIENAMHVPLGQLIDYCLHNFSKNQPIILYCKSGVRSLYGKQRLEMLEFTQVSHLEGGIEWAMKTKSHNLSG